MTRRNRDLEARLQEWGREYRGGKYEYIGFSSQNILQTLIDHKGFVPDSRGFVPIPERTAADEVEGAVNALGGQRSGELPALVIRCEYTCSSLPIEERLRRMRKVGHSLQRVRYYQLLRLARVHVAGWLRLPFDEEEESTAKGVV